MAPTGLAPALCRLKGERISYLCYEPNLTLFHTKITLLAQESNLAHRVIAQYATTTLANLF